MKKVFFLLALVFCSNAVSAADFARTAKIALMRSHGAFWGSDSWIQLEGISGISGCQEGSEGAGSLTYVVVPSTEQQLFSFLLAAHMANKTLDVTISSDALLHGLCTVKYASFGR